MVLKPENNIDHKHYEFENDVKMYGTQTRMKAWKAQDLFENDVKMYGTQTPQFQSMQIYLFENDVKMYGTQTMTHLHSSTFLV